jgi:hypothetical protein
MALAGNNEKKKGVQKPPSFFLTTIVEIPCNGGAKKELVECTMPLYCALIHN